MRDVWSQQEPQMLLQQGLYAEEVQGDLNRAISFYQEIIKKYAEHRVITARALLQLGSCYEKLGQDRAIEAYQKIVTYYPDQIEIVTIARTKLTKLIKTKSANPLVKYYFERTGLDPMSATSFDGKYLAYTDWTTGNLAVKNLLTTEIKILTATNWHHSEEYALRPAWSRDGQFIAYGWQRQPYYIELRIVALTDGKSQIIYSDPDLIIYPHDWSPDGKYILCESFDFKRMPANRLALISLTDKTLQDLFALSPDSRGFMFSPDGNFITYDFLKGDHRHVFVYLLKERASIQLSTGSFGEYGFDDPQWSADGNLILCRSVRLGKHDLWAFPIANGRPAGKPFLVQSDLTDWLLPRATIIEHFKKIEQTKKKYPHSATGYSFIEEFSSPKLDSSWTIFQWVNPNIYGYASFGRYSLSDHPGYLRYYLDPATATGYQINYLPKFTEWYWYYPALEISRPLYGNRWLLETKLTYSMLDGANTRRFELLIFFEPEKTLESALSIQRVKSIARYSPTGINVDLFAHPMNQRIVTRYAALADSFGITGIFYYFRIYRENQTIRLQVSEDDYHYQEIIAAELPPEVTSPVQILALSGESWFVPAGSYVEIDYIRFRPLP